MAMTYTTPENEAYCAETDGEVFVPSFARTRRNTNKPVKTWMILAPIGAVVVLGAAGLMLMGGGEEAAIPASAAMEARTAIARPLAAQTSPVAAPTEAPVETVAPAAEPVPSVARRASAPARPAARAAPAPAPAPAQMVREETPVEPTGPRPYDASPATAAPPSIQTAPLTAAPAATPATPPAPVIPVQPLN